MYDPAKVRRFKSSLALYTRMNYSGQPLEGQLSVRIIFYRRIQKSLSKKERRRRLSGAHRPSVKPDVDNYIKSTLDGLIGVLWKDDNQIVDLYAHKFYSSNPHIEIEVKKVG